MRRWVPILLIVVAVIASIVAYPGMPERVPTHWNTAGEVDGWSSRFMGAWLISLVPTEWQVEVLLKRTLGIALLISTGGLLLRAVMQVWNNRLPLGEGPAPMTRPNVVIRPIPTLLLGAVAGLMVGLTSVGAGSIVVVVLLLMGRL